MSSLKIDELRGLLGGIGARYQISGRKPLGGYLIDSNPEKPNTIQLPGGICLGFQAKDEEPVPNVDPINRKRSRQSWFIDEYGETVKRDGTDVLAWYQSFHNSDEAWGIYIPMSSLHFIAHVYLKKLRRPYETKLELALQALIHHEGMHYAVDRNIAAWEIVYQKPLSRHSDRLKNSSGHIELEEALANAQKLREIAALGNEPSLRAIKSWVEKSPAGYKDGVDYVEDDAFNGLLQKVIHAQVSNGLAPDSVLPSEWVDWAGSFPVDGEIDLSLCPVYLIDDGQASKGFSTYFAYTLLTIPVIRESRKFLKMLAKTPHEIQSNWQEKKQALASAVPGHPEFEKLKGKLRGLFSIRLNLNFRAHLKPTLSDASWDAIAVGTHTKMKHG